MLMSNCSNVQQCCACITQIYDSCTHAGRLVAKYASGRILQRRAATANLSLTERSKKRIENYGKDIKKELSHMLNWLLVYWLL
jgi:hypothetical protein